MTFAQPFKDYEILDRIGSGAMGTVFRARHKSLNRIVALKVLRPSLARDQRYVNRLSREARIVAAFNHPNIVAGYDLGQEGAYHFFVMELVEGKSLRELLSEWGSFPEAQVLETAIKIASALDHAYKKGIIHRDIKPGNILIDATNTVKLTDMGLAKGPADLTITREGATVGTPQYISPEQARDPQNVDVRSDLYSLGATLFHMCTGQPPFRAETMASVILKVINERAPSARDINPDVSEELSLVIRKLMAKDPDLRYQTPAELLADLQRVRRDERPDVNLRQLEALDHVGSTRRRRAMVAGGVAGLALVVAASLLIFGDDGDRREPEVVAHPDYDYREELRKDLDRQEWPDRFAALRSRELVVANDGQRRILANARTALEQDLRRELEGFFARQDDALRQWILDWGAGSRFLEGELPDRLYRRFGLRPSELPPGLRGAYDEHVARLQAEVQDLESERDDAYLARLDGHHQSFYATCHEYRNRLEDRDFRGAEQRLLRALRGFQGDGPERADMSPALRQEIDRRQEKVRNRELERIDREERRVADQLRARAGSVVEQVRELLGGAATATNPRDARRKLAAERQRLLALFPPEHFRSDSSPWPEVEARLDAVERDVELASTTYERELKRLAVRDAYRIALADGRAGDAAAYLEGRDLQIGEQELAQHTELLRQAGKAQHRLLARIQERTGSRFQVERLPGRTEVSVVLRREEDGRLVMKHRRQVVSLATVNLLPLEQLAGGDDLRAQLTADERAGLAVWYVLGGDFAQVARLMPKGRRSEFLYQDVQPLAKQLRKEELGPQMAATRLLEDAQKALKEGEWQKALDTVPQIHQQHPAFYQSHAVVLERIKHKAADGQLRAQKLAFLEEKAPPGTKVSMAGWRVSVDHPLGTVDLGLREGWRRSGQADGGVSFVRPAPTLASAHRSALVLPSPFAKDEIEEIIVRIWLSFPEASSSGRRLVLFRCHGVGVVLGLVRNGGVVAYAVKASELENLPRLHQRMQPELVAIAHKRNVRIIEPGARHQLKLVVRRHGGRLRGELHLDEESRSLTDFDVSGSRAVPELAVIAMHPLTLYAVRFEGEARPGTR